MRCVCACVHGYCVYACACACACVCACVRAWMRVCACMCVRAYMWFNNPLPPIYLSHALRTQPSQGTRTQALQMAPLPTEAALPGALNQPSRSLPLDRTATLAMEVGVARTCVNESCRVPLPVPGQLHLKHPATDLGRH